MKGNLKSLGYPCDTLEESEEYWELYACFAPERLGRYIIWCEWIGDMVFPHFAVNKGIKYDGAGAEFLRGVEDLFFEWSEELGCRDFVIVVKDGSVGYRVGKMLGFSEIHRTRASVFLLREF